MDEAQCGRRTVSKLGWRELKLCISRGRSKIQGRQAGALLLEVSRAVLKNVNSTAEEF